MARRGHAIQKFYQRMFVPGSMRVGATGVEQLSGPLMPKSGTAGDGVGSAPLGSIYTDTTRGIRFVNEGTKAAPYWTPVSYDQPGLYAINAPHFFDHEEKAEANTDTSEELAPSGWTLVGDGIHENDSGALVQTATQGDPGALRLSSSAAAAGDLCALSTPVVSGAGIYQPDDNDMAVIDVNLASVGALTARIIYLGFAGIVAEGETDVVTAATTVTTLTQNDVAGLYMASTATDPDRIIAAFSKAGTPSTQDYAVITGLNTGVNMPAAATALRFRAEVDGDGAIRLFLAKALVFTGAAATLAVDQELNALVYVSPTAATQAEIDVFRASFYMGVS